MSQKETISPLIDASKSFGNMPNCGELVRDKIFEYKSCDQPKPLLSFQQPIQR